VNPTKLLGALKRQALIVAGVILIGIVVFAWAVTLGPKYQATASVVAFASGGALGFQNPSRSDPLADPSSAVIVPSDVSALIRSAPLLTAVAQSVHLTPTLAKTLKKRVSTKNTMGSEVISLEVTDNVPERAIATANAFASQLRTFESELATSRYDGLIRDLRGQVRKRAEGLRALDARIASFSARDPYLSAEMGTAAINQQIVMEQQQYAQALANERADAATANVVAQRPALARKLADQEIIMNDPEFKERLTQFGKDAAKRDLTAAGYTTAFPGLAGINEQVARENASLRQAERAATSDPARSKAYVDAQLDANKARAALAADRAQLAAIQAQLSEARAHLSGSGGAAVQINSLRRDRDAANAAFVVLSQRLATTIADRSQAASIGTVVVVDPAVEAMPTLLSQPSVLAVAIGFSFAWLAISIALAADAFDNRLHDSGAVERLYGRPVLTTI